MIKQYCPICECECKKEELPEERDYCVIECSNCNSEFIIGDSVLKNDGSTQGRREVCKRFNAIYEFLLRSPFRTQKMKKNRHRFFYAHDYIVRDTDPVGYINVADLLKNYPKNVGEKLDRGLLNLAILFPVAGLLITGSVLNAAMYADSELREIETLAYLDYLSELGYYNKNSTKLTAKAWERIAELTKKQNEINQGFIAMWFNTETKSISDAFKNAIDTCGYIPKRIDEKEHNNQIVPEILYEIDRSKFVVVDVTYPNYGAYYEAGYAQALGKQVIICCRKKEFDDSDARPHFDISQKSMVVWVDENELTERLIKRIRATVGTNKQEYEIKEIL